MKIRQALAHGATAEPSRDKMADHELSMQRETTQF